MPITDGDWAYEQYVVEQQVAEMEREFREVGAEELRKECLQSFYLNHPLVAGPALDALSEARRLAETSPRAALVLSSVAIELGYREALVRPVVYGLVHSELSARLVADMVMAHSALDRFHDILSQILRDYAGVELKTFRRSGVEVTLWEEIKKVQALRNRVIHRGDSVSPGESNHALDVASAILEKVYPMVVTNLGLRLGSGLEIDTGGAIQQLDS